MAVATPDSRRDGTADDRSIADRRRLRLQRLTVATLWFVGWLLLGVARTGDVRSVFVGALVLNWLGLPIVLVGICDIVPGSWLARASAGWATIQLIVWLTLFSAVGSMTLTSKQMFASGVGLIVLVLGVTWTIAAGRSWRQRRGRFPGDRLRARSVARAAIAVALGVVLTFLGAGLWSDDILVYFALSASLSACLGFTWWTARRGQLDRRAWCLTGLLFVACLAFDSAIGGLGPFGIAVQATAFFGVVAWLAQDRTRSVEAPAEVIEPVTPARPTAGWLTLIG